jgi:hypothetical protein
MRPVRVLAALAFAITATVGLSGCSGSGITSGRVSAAVGPAFARLYEVQQHQLGKAVVNQPDGVANCARGNTSSPRHGAGDDWVCILNFPFPDGHVQPINYDVQVAPSGCYTAAGPAQVVGPQQQRTPSGTTTNPLFEFDGCFDIT